MQLRTPGTVIAGLVGWLAAQRPAGADPLDGLAPSPLAEAVIVAGIGIVMGGPWVTSLWILLRHSSRGPAAAGRGDQGKEVAAAVDREVVIGLLASSELALELPVHRPRRSWR